VVRSSSSSSTASNAVPHSADRQASKATAGACGARHPLTVRYFPTHLQLLLR
jgi:hypothetical protein